MNYLESKKTATAPGFRPVDILLKPSDLRGLWFHLIWKAEHLDPELTETEQTAPHIWDRKHKAKYLAACDSVKARVLKAAPRFAKRRDWIAARNRETLAAMSIDEARASLIDGVDCYSLKWHEQLPHGIDAQLAANATGLEVWRDWWEGQVQRSICYFPDGRKPRKFYQVAKAI